MELVAADPNRSCDCGLDDRNAMATAEYFANPYVFLDELRESCPVHWSKTLGGWLLTRHEDCDWCLKRPDLFTSRHHTARQVEALSRAGDSSAALQLAEDYVRRFPSGRKLRSVQRFGGLK